VQNSYALPPLDFNGDGHIDVFLSAYTDMSHPVEAYVLWNNGQTLKKESLGYENWQHAVAVYDINNDGYDDIIMAGYASNIRYLGSPTGLTGYFGGPGSSGLAVGDFLNDGSVTAVYVDAGSKSNDTFLYSIDITENFISSNVISTLPGPRLENLNPFVTDSPFSEIPSHDIRARSFDFNFDGRLDIFSSNKVWVDDSLNKGSSLLLNNEFGQFVSTDSTLLNETITSQKQGLLVRGPNNQLYLLTKVINRNGEAFVGDTNGTKNLDFDIYIQTLSFPERDNSENLQGTPDNDLIWGLGGNDSIFGGLGNDIINGGIGIDVAVFNRAPDATGLYYWASNVYQGQTFNQVAENFFLAPETQALYPNPITTQSSVSEMTEFINAVYQNVLNRTPDTDGLNYWINGLQEGSSTATKFILQIIKAAVSPTGSPIDAEYFTTKGEVGEHFSITNGLTNVDQAIAVMDLFNSTYSHDINNLESAKVAATTLADTFLANVGSNPQLVVQLINYDML
jgi:hypothetical protein